MEEEQGHTVQYPSGRNKAQQQAPLLVGAACGCAMVVIFAVIVLLIILALSRSTS
jgi:hypothetical protein